MTVYIDSMICLRFSALVLALIAPLFFATAAKSNDSVKNSISNLGETRNLKFEAYWGGLHAVNFLLSYSTAPGEMKNVFHLETAGILKLLLKMRIKAEAKGSSSKNDLYIPQSYQVDYENRYRTRKVTISFDSKSGIVIPKITTKGADEEKDRATEAKVPPEMRKGTIDPISAVVEAIRRTKNHIENGASKNFTIPVYDGRRRFDVIGEVQETIQRTILFKPYKVIRLVLTPKTRAGFKKSHTELWSKYAFHIYLTTDGRYVPLQIDAVGPGPIINLVKECDTAEACLPSK
ncbi:MAG: DUF3108 domain-containing protein [Rhodospirillales bacterium]|nr:DUF3108 domain-containing protein [Rhodospirillales bacterium]